MKRPSRRSRSQPVGRRGRGDRACCGPATVADPTSGMSECSQTSRLAVEGRPAQLASVAAPTVQIGGRATGTPKWQDSSASSPPCGVHQRTPSGRSGRTWPGWTRRRQASRRQSRNPATCALDATGTASQACIGASKLTEVCMTTACRRSLCSGRFETLLRAGRRSSADTRAK